MSNIPEHLAIIMDGNGRWAEEQGMPRAAGHKKGAEAVKAVLEQAQKRGVKIVTLFAFSSENWKRPPAEVETLIGIFRSYINQDIKELQKKSARVSFIGERLKFPADLVKKMDEIERDTAGFKEFHVVVALSYGARGDIVSAVKKIAVDILDRKYLVSHIDEAKITDALSTQGLPCPDLVIRTSGEQRLSNFLLWESAYAELYFTPVYWPDFNEHDLDAALDAYARRNRRFGSLDAAQPAADGDA